MIKDYDWCPLVRLAGLTQYRQLQNNLILGDLCQRSLNWNLNPRYFRWWRIVIWTKKFPFCWEIGPGTLLNIDIFIIQPDCIWIRKIFACEFIIVHHSNSMNSHDSVKTEPLSLKSQTQSHMCSIYSLSLFKNQIHSWYVLISTQNDRFMCTI